MLKCCWNFVTTQQCLFNELDCKLWNSVHYYITSYISTVSHDVLCLRWGLCVLLMFICWAFEVQSRPQIISDNIFNFFVLLNLNFNHILCRKISFTKLTLFFPNNEMCQDSNKEAELSWDGVKCFIFAVFGGAIREMFGLLTLVYCN